MKPEIEFMSSKCSYDTHEWSDSRKGDRKCVKCGKDARQNMTEACQARYEIFKDLKAPISAHGGKKK